MPSNTESSNSIEPIKKITLGNQIIELVINNIENGTWPVNYKLPNEIELASSLNVSRNIMRESMKILETFGILESKVAKGTHISNNARLNISNYRFFKSLRENTSVKMLLEARHSLEPSIAFYAAQRITTSDIEELTAMLDEFIASNSYNFDNNFEFHMYLAKITGNTLLINFSNTIFEHLRASSYSEINKHLDEETKHRTIKEHCAILDAMKKGDANGAKALMELHISDSLTNIATRYRDEELSGEA